MLDQKTGDDLTSLTLAQILLEGLRQRTARIPRLLLVQLVRLSAAVRSGSPWPRPRRRRTGRGSRRRRSRTGCSPGDA